MNSTRDAFLLTIPLAFGLSHPLAAQNPGPQILHNGLRCIAAGEHVILQALVEPVDEVETVKVYFRANMYSLFYYVEMERAGLGFQGVLPKPSTEINGMVYYLEAVDRSFNSIRTEEYTPEVRGNRADCRDDNPLPIYLEGPASIAVGATEAGPAFPSGFLTDGIVTTISTLGVASNPGGISGTAVAIGVAAGAGAGVAVLIGTSGSNDPEPGMPPVGPQPPGSTTTTSTTTTTAPSASMVEACFRTFRMPPTISVGQSVRFDASCTMPDRDQIASYAWRFNDGRSDREGRVVNRVYNQPGTFPAKLTVTDLQGNQDTTSRDVVVVEVPTGGGGGGGGGGPAAALAIGKSGPPAANIGVPFIYTVTLTNTSGLPATGIVITDVVPPSLTIGVVNFNPPNINACNTVGNTVTCTSANLGPGLSGVITISVTPTVAGPLTNTASFTSVNPNEASGAGVMTNVTLLAPMSADNQSASTSFTSHLDLPPGDGSVRTRVQLNDGRIDTTDNAAPFQHALRGREGGNTIEASLIGQPAAEGRWRFDFSNTAGLEPGSLRIDSGDVVSTSSDSVVFRVHQSGQRIRFRFRLSR